MGVGPEEHGRKSEHVRPADLVLRCYGRRTGRSPRRWVAHCIDLDLWAVGDDWEGTRRSLEDAIVGYLETVLDTRDQRSIPALVRRRAPTRFVVLWHLIRFMGLFLPNGRGPLDTRSFEEPIPFHLAAA